MTVDAVQKDREYGYKCGTGKSPVIQGLNREQLQPKDHEKSKSSGSSRSDTNSVGSRNASQASNSKSNIVTMRTHSMTNVAQQEQQQFVTETKPLSRTSTSSLPSIAENSSEDSITSESGKFMSSPKIEILEENAKDHGQEHGEEHENNTLPADAQIVYGTGLGVYRRWMETPSSSEDSTYVKNQV